MTSVKVSWKRKYKQIQKTCFSAFMICNKQRNVPCSSFTPQDSWLETVHSSRG